MSLRAKVQEWLYQDTGVGTTFAAQERLLALIPEGAVLVTQESLAAADFEEHELHRNKQKWADLPDDNYKQWWRDHAAAILARHRGLPDSEPVKTTS